MVYTYIYLCINYDNKIHEIEKLNHQISILIALYVPLLTSSLYIINRKKKEFYL